MTSDLTKNSNSYYTCDYLRFPLENFGNIIGPYTSVYHDPVSFETAGHYIWSDYLQGYAFPYLHPPNTSLTKLLNFEALSVLLVRNLFQVISYIKWFQYLERTIYLEMVLV